MTIDELRSAAAIVRDATEEGENTATRIGQLFLDTVNTLCNVSTNAIKGYVVISSTSDLPTSPTTDQQMKGYLLDTTLYVWVGTGGDTLDGKYQSAQLKGEDGKTGPKGDSGVHLGDVVLVNDLTTGGEGNALSAEQGKILGQRSEYPMEMVQPSESGAIRITSGLDWTISGWWHTPYTKIDPTKPIYAKGDSNNASVAFVAFYDDNLVCKGTVSQLGAAGVEYEVQVPDGATCARVVCTTAQKVTSYLTQKVQRNLNDVVVEHDETINAEINLIDLVNRFTPGYLELNTGVQTTQLYSTSDYIFLDESLDITLFMATLYGAPMDVISFYTDKKDTTYLGGLHHLVDNTDEKHFHKLDIPKGAKWMRVCGPDEAKIRAIKLMVNQRDYTTSQVDALANANDYNPARFLLPTNIDVVVGRQCDFFVQDTIYNINKLPYVYSMPSTITDYGKGHLRINASSAGTDQIMLKTYKQDRYINDCLVGTQTINVRKVAKSGMSGTFNVLIVGDSLVQYGPNPSETYRLLNEDGDVTINQIGLQSQILDGVTYHHEGYGGWTWARFNSGSDSPFVFNGQLSFAQYMATNFPTLSGIDFCVVMLGTNDSEGYTLPGAKTFVDALLDDYPNCKIAIGILAYGRPCEGMPTDMERKLRTANVEYLDTFDNGKYHANVTCIGQGCWIDRVNDYQHEEADSTPYSSDKFIRYTDGVHPKTQGYKQWGRAVYCKIRSWIAGNL